MCDIDTIILPNSNKKYVFIVSTHYHILYSLVLIERLNIKNESLIVLRYLPDYLYELAEQLKEKGYEIIKWGKPFKRNLFGRINYYISITRDRSFLRKYRNVHPENKIILMNFAWNIKHVYYCAKAYFELCDFAFFFEEGPNCYCNYTGNRFELLIKRIIGDEFEYYKKEKLKKIFVTLPEKYPTYLQPKLVHMSLFDLWNEIDESARNTVLKTFVSDETYKKLENLTNVGIVYTQPLSEDGYISEEEKIRTYREICLYYSKYGQILLKPHPRDTSEYSFEGIEVIDRLWPSEVLSLFGIKFIFSIGICTSAVTGTDALIKLNLNENYLSDHKLDMIPLNMGDIQIN